ncbi:GNAT family N-acetyltransferase [Falsiroseomonas ponticola]|uniref:GNAT family N-acetyltransferase n=1 Tax=Falsiroseomonas ponticola TaxID=2786951 RepID=UPI001932D43E|nr:GNAT family N-acetyltransferase [Roseomonas ponticola]
MHRLPAADARRLLPRYLAEPAFFPLVAAVLEGRQDGVVWADDPADPRQAYVEHRFGFAQAFGAPNPEFEAALAGYLTARAFPVEKVRLYTPLLPACLAAPAFQPMRSERQRYRLAAPAATAAPGEARPATAADAAELQARFGIVTRFWRSEADFIGGAQAQLIHREGRIAALCYAAATGGGRAEIDVLTDPDCRRQGLARQVVGAFIAACGTAGLEPVWDAFTNNLPSIRTALSMGFVPSGPAYAFFTIPRAAGTP